MFTPAGVQQQPQFEIAQRDPTKGYENNYVKFYERPMLDELLTEGGSVPTRNLTAERLDELKAIPGAKLDHDVNPNDHTSWEVLRVPAAGRPIYKNRDYIVVQVPGDLFNQTNTLVDQDHIRRYPKHWAEYQANKSKKEQMIGTPLGIAGIITPERIEELAFFKILTVEHLASVSDTLISRLGLTARTEREKAKDYLETLKGYAPVATLRNEVERSNATIVDQQRQLQEMAAQIAELRRGRAADAIATAAAGSAFPPAYVPGGYVPTPGPGMPSQGYQAAHQSPTAAPDDASLQQLVRQRKAVKSRAATADEPEQDTTPDAPRAKRSRRKGTTAGQEKR